MVVQIQLCLLSVSENRTVAGAPRTAYTKEREEILCEGRLQVPWLPVYGPVTLVAELVAQVPSKVSVLVHPPARHAESITSVRGMVKAQ